MQPIVGKFIYLLPVLLHGKSSDLDKVLLADQSVSLEEPEVHPVPELCERLQNKT